MNIPESVIHRDIIIDGEHVAQVIENTLTNRRHDFITSEEKNFPTGPLASIYLFFSIVKYASPDPPCDFAHLSRLSKKLLA